MLSSGNAVRIPSWAVFLIMLGTAYLLFANTFGAAWTYDDFPVIVNNPDILSWEAFLADLRPGRPLRELTYLFDHALFGMEPSGWHFQQIFWHGMNGFLAFLLIRVFGGSQRLGLMTGLLFLCHPVQVEVVANLSHRKDSLLLAFALLATLAYCRFLKVLSNPARLCWLGLSLLAALLACQAKQSGIVLPGIFIVCELLLSPRDRRYLARPAILLVLGGGMLIGAAVYMLGQGDILNAYQRGIRNLMHLRVGWTGEVTPVLYLLMVLKSWMFLWSKLFWPTGLALEYTYSPPDGVLDVSVLACLLLIIGAGWLAAMLGRRQPLLLFALSWFLLFWLPVSNLWPLTYFAADRYLYAPSLGFCLLLALGLDALMTRWRSEGWLLCTAIVLACSLLTWQQNRVWASSFSLWQQAVEVSPKASFALNNLGWNYLQQGDRVKARELFQRAAENPYNPNPHDNLGWLYEQAGEWRLAVHHYRRFIEIGGRSPQYRARADFLKRYLAQQYQVHID